MNQEDAKSAIDSSTPVLILRYEKDKICPAERINAIMTRIPSAVLPPQPLQGKLDGIGSHPTLTDQYRKSCTKEVVAVSDAAIKYVTQFLFDHLG